MACRIGITTDVAERRAHWLRQHPRMTNWQVLEVHNTRTAAQAAETRLASRYNCQAHAGGGGAERAQWSVYYFQY